MAIYKIQVRHPVKTAGEWIDHSQNWYAVSENYWHTQKYLEDIISIYNDRTPEEKFEYRIVVRKEFNGCDGCVQCKTIQEKGKKK